MSEKKRTAPRLTAGKIWSGYSFIFIFAAIFIAYYLVNASLTWVGKEKKAMYAYAHHLINYEIRIGCQSLYSKGLTFTTLIDHFTAAVRSSVVKLSFELNQ